MKTSEEIKTRIEELNKLNLASGFDEGWQEGHIEALEWVLGEE